jgi:hypothetical protein
MAPKLTKTTLKQLEWFPSKFSIGFVQILLYKKPFLAGIVGISLLFTNTRYLIVVINTNLVGYVIIIGIPCTPLTIVVKNCDTWLVIPPWNVMPSCYDTMVFGSVLFLNPSIERMAYV